MSRRNAATGLILRKHLTARPAFAQPIDLAPKATTAEAFQIIAMSCLRHLAGNKSAVLSGNTEAVHQMRVGLRRMRAAISVFKQMLQGKDTKRVTNGLKWLSLELGPARDMDVLASETLRPMSKSAPHPEAVAALKNDIINLRDKGISRAKRAVNSDRYRRLILDTVLWIKDGQWTRSRVALIAVQRKQRASSFAGHESKRRTRKALMRMAKIDKLSVHERHRLRIAIKKLRYATEYFGSLFPTKKRRLKKFSAILEDLQSLLGQLNDIWVHSKLAGSYLDPTHGTRAAVRKAFAMGLLAGEEHAKIRELLKKIKRHGKRLERCEPFWD